MLGDHKNAVLQFSGGKDSTALMYLARPWLDKITVLFAETGATFPHLVKHIEDTCRLLNARLEIVRAPFDVFQHTETFGLPSDVVPVEASFVAKLFVNPPPKQVLQPYTSCCGAMLWDPMMKYIADNGVDLVLRGSKASDHRRGVANSQVNGVTFASPLWDWSDNDVHEYLRREGASLPDHYKTINDSLDCWMCTAHLAHHGDEKMRYIRENYPDLWPTVAERMGRVKAAIDNEMARIKPAIDIATG